MLLFLLLKLRICVPAGAALIAHQQTYSANNSNAGGALALQTVTRASVPDSCVVSFLILQGTGRRVSAAPTAANTTGTTASAESASSSAGKNASTACQLHLWVCIFATLQSHAGAAAIICCCFYYAVVMQQQQRQIQPFIATSYVLSC
jgi:hypothetical protein